MRMTRKRRKTRDRQQHVEQNIRNVISKSAYLAVAGIIAVQSGDMGQVYAMPQGGQVVAGQAGIHQAGQTMTIAQQTAQAIINWRSFGIMPNEHVNFLQPGANSVMLNRVLGNDPSAIYGKLTANGKVFLVNPNGVFFAPGAQVNVGGIVATTLSITDADFMNGKYQFKNNGKAGSVVNQGTITAEEQGLVALLAPEVKNEGIIAAKKGTVALAAGDQMTLDYAGDGKIQLAVTEGAFKAAAENKGLLEADGGIVLMTARGNQDVTSSVVNQSGIIRARSLDGKTGEVTLDAGRGAVRVAKSVDVSGTNDHSGGKFNAYGKDIMLTGTATIDASGEAGGGTVRIGGDWQGKGDAPHADSVTMEKGAAIHADATKKGDGGKVVLWSDGTTKFAGEITAQGGAAGGDGGMVETSGHVLNVGDATVNAGAAKGKGGEWLLDPYDMEVVAGTGGSFTAGQNDSKVGADTIAGALNNGTSVTLQTGTGGTQAGNITVNAAINKTAGGDATLKLEAYGSIAVNEDIKSTSSGNRLNVILNAGAQSGAGVKAEVSLADGKTIETHGGNVSIYGGNKKDAAGKDVPEYTTGVKIGGSINTAGGASGGDITIYGGTVSDKKITLSSTGSLRSGGGKIALNSLGMDLLGSIASGSGDISLRGDQMAFGGVGSITGTGKVQIAQFDKGTISLGGSGGLTLAGNLFGGASAFSGFSSYQIGNADTSTITVNGASFDKDVTLESGGAVTVSGALNAGAHNVTLKAGAASGGAGVVTAGTLDLQGKTAAFTFSGANKINQLTGDVKNVTFKNAQDFSVGAAGLSSDKDKIDITANGTLTIDGAVASGGGAVNLTADQLTLKQEVNSGSGDITLAIDGITGTGVSGGLIKGTGKLVIDRNTAGEISLGDTGGTGLHFDTAAFGGNAALFGDTFNSGVFIGGAKTNTVSVNGGLTVGDALTVTSQGAMNFAANGAIRTVGNENLTFNAGNIAFNGSNTMGAGAGTLTVNTDQITGWSNVAFDAANNAGSLVIAPKTSNTAIEIGGNTETGKLAVTAGGLAAIKNGNFKNVQIGQGEANGTNKGTGAVTLYGFTQPAANFTINGGAGTFVSGTMKNGLDETLTLNLDSLTQSAGSVFDIGGNLVLNGTGAFNLNSTGNVKFDNLTAKNVGAMDVYSPSLGLNGIQSTGNITLTTDNITNVLGNVKTTGGDILLKTITGDKNITIGGSKVAEGMWLDAAWMNNFGAHGKLTIGDQTNYTGRITVTDTTFGSAVEFLTDKAANRGNVVFNGNVYAGAAGDKDMWITTWSWAWTGATVHVEDIHLDIGQGLSGGGEVQSNGGNVYFTKPANTDIYITNGNEAQGKGYQIAYDFLNGMTDFDNFLIEGDKNIYMFGGNINQSVNVTAKDNVEVNGQVNIGRIDETKVTEVGITGNDITLSSGTGIAVGNNKLTLTADTLTDNPATGMITGTTDGALTVQQRTDGKALSIGSVSAGGLHFTKDQLNGGLFGTGFGSLTLGSENGGNVTTDMDLALNNNLTIQAGSGAEIKLGGNLTIGSNGKEYKVTLKGETISNHKGTTNYTIDAGQGTLNLYGNAFDLQGTGTVKGNGTLGIGAYDDNGAIYLGKKGSAGTGLDLENTFFSTVFFGFDSYKIGNGGASQTITVDTANLAKNTILDANTVKFTGTGDSMTMGQNTTLTLKAENVTQDTGADLNIANLALQGSNTSKVTLLNAANAIGGTVSGEGHTIQVAAKELNVDKIEGKGDNTGLIELASDNITFSGGAGSISGAGELYVHQNSTKELYLGTATGSNGLALGQGGAFDQFGTGFKYVSLGNKNGKGRVTFGGDLNFANNTTVYGNWIGFTPGAVTTANKWLTFDTETFQMNNGSSINTYTGALTLTTDNLDLQDGSKIYGTGDLLLQTKKTDRNLYLGSNGTNIDGSKGLVLQSHYFQDGTNRVFMDRGSANIIIGNANHTGTLTQADSTQFTDNVIIRQAANNTTGGYSASGVINTGGANFTVESQNATFTNADVTTGTGKISIKTDNLTMTGANSFTGTGGLWLDTYTQGKEINIGGSGGGLNLDVGWFGAGGVFNGVTGGINIGAGNAGNITVSENVTFANNDVKLTAGGKLSGTGTIDMSGKNLSTEAKTEINYTGELKNVNQLTAKSDGAVQLTNANNTITGIGSVEAGKGVMIKEKDGVMINGIVQGNKSGSKENISIETGGGTLGIGQAGKLVSNGGDVVLTARGNDGRFVTNNKGAAKDIFATGNGKWLIFTYDALNDDYGNLAGEFRKYGAENDFGDASKFNQSGSVHTWKPTATITAEKTYGEANNQFFTNGSFTITIDDADGGAKRMAADKKFLGSKDDFELINGQKDPNSYHYGSAIEANDGVGLGVNKNIGGTGNNGTAYGTDSSLSADKQINYTPDNDRNYGVKVEFWVNPKEITIGANNDTVDYGQLGSNGYQGNASNPNGTLNGTFGNGWGNPSGLVGGQTIVWDAAQGKFVAAGVDGFSGGVNGYTGNSQGALVPGEYNLGLSGDLYADNYIFTYVPGHLTVTDVNGSYVPPTPPGPQNPKPNDPVMGAVGTVNSVMKAQPPDDLVVENLPNRSSRMRMRSSLMGDIDPNVPALNLEGMVSVVDVAAAVDFPQGDMDVKAQGRSSSIRLYADRSGFGMLLGGIEGDYRPESSRTDGAIPVLYTDYSSVGTDGEQALDGFYDVVYTPEKLSIEPKAQGETVPRRSEIKPELRQDYAVAYKDARLGDFRVAFGNGILTVHPQDQKAVDTIMNERKPAQRAVLTAGVLRAIQDFGVTPDQLRAIYLFREKQALVVQARKG